MAFFVPYEAPQGLESDVDRAAPSEGSQEIVQGTVEGGKQHGGKALSSMSPSRSSAQKKPKQAKRSRSRSPGAASPKTPGRGNSKQASTPMRTPVRTPVRSPPSSRHGVRKSQEVLADERQLRLAGTGLLRDGMSRQAEAAVLQQLKPWRLTEARPQLLLLAPTPALKMYLKEKQLTAEGAAKWLRKKRCGVMDRFDQCFDSYLKAVRFWHEAPIGEIQSLGGLLVKRGNHVSADGSSWFQATWDAWACLWACQPPTFSAGLCGLDASDADSDSDLDEVMLEPDDDFGLSADAQLLGQGAFAEVYRTTWRGQVVAMKKGNVHLREVELGKKMADSGLFVKVLGGCEGWLAMEFLSGSKTLEEVLWSGDVYRLGHLPTHPRVHRDDAAVYIQNLMSACDYMASRDVVHRDMKSANALVVGRGLKVIDFGASVPLSSYLATPRAYDVTGTPTHWPVSVWTSLAQATAPILSDRFAVGVTIGEIVTQSQGWQHFRNYFLFLIRATRETSGLQSAVHD
eukprot:TRINITY_DN8052_c0_g1_i3.p1 TRINITY_DN8052_c0_g1~~TRINITY_DN8052_c0_g1_i3.p1  ORF type:complete len:514 (-),score=120.50 TRINITY_DN8052_c0_g1_i3:260-1801(-)